MKTQNKIILFLTTVFFFYLLLFSGFIYYTLNNYFYTDFYKRLEIRAATAAKIELENRTDIDAVREIRQEYLEILPEEKIIIIDPEDELTNELERFKLSKSFFNEIESKNRASFNRNNTYYSGIKYETNGKTYYVIASAENYYSSHHTLYLRNLLIVGLITSCIIIFIIAYLFSRKVLAPVEDIVRRMRNISTENLNERLPMPKNNNELAAMTNTFNEMLNRLETSFEIQKNFISNASHELNTPLTSIIGQAEIALSKPRLAEAYIKSLYAILEDAEKLSLKTEALLSLAQTSYNNSHHLFEEIRLDELLIDVKENIIKLYPEAKIHIDFSHLPDTPEKLKFCGNKQLLHLALFNIIMNASKYSNHQKVNVALAVSSENIIIVIKDRGIGIPKDELNHIYDPFFRASNTTKYKGYGIGLPLSRNIIRIHHGVLNVSSIDQQGTTVEIKIPVS
ncbi:ATP-binding protein [Salegentibacter sp. Hel_I_6]|uniref:HAMP domain-containing sensor histidine kinase n=1 Tax=Salegentibacter sp. Hel_I_6 TaxID=1250278 RepID=UPI00055E812D|nr:ATP-binding protein [Salegentibacter sp. Hel_I_6]